MSRAPGDSLDLNLPRQHGWLLLAPAVDVLGLFLLFPLFLRGFVAERGVTIEPPSSSLVLEDFDHALGVWLPAGDAALRCDGHSLTFAEFTAWLDRQRAAGADALLIHADRAAPHERVMKLTEAAISRGYRVGYAALPEEPHARQS